MTEVEPTAGRLLVAHPKMGDPTFARTVVLMLDHDEAGSLGIVINRPTDADLVEPLTRWRLLTLEPRSVFWGGPVQPEGVLAVARRRDGEELPAGAAAVTDALCLIDLHAEPDDAVGIIEGMRIFGGYAGWGPGQLTAEMAGGDWLVVPSEPADAFSDKPDDLWRSVLRRQGPPYAMWANQPIDPSLN